MHASYVSITFLQHAGGRQRQSFALLLSSNSEYTCCMIRDAQKSWGEQAGMQQRRCSRESLSVFCSILLH